MKKGQVRWGAALLLAFALTTQGNAQDRVPELHVAPQTFVMRFSGNTVTEAVLLPKAIAQNITVQLRNVTVQHALDAIALEGKFTLLYSRDVVPVDKKVSVDVRQGSVADALKQVLRGEELELLVSSTGQMAIVPSAFGQAEQGVVAGKVVSAKTKQPVEGARVTVGDAASGVVTGADGTFRLVVSAGKHQVAVRGVGFARQMQIVTVGDGETVTLEIVLESSASVLNEVIVTGTVIATERKAIPNPITVITAEDIEKRGITRIEQFFRGEVPGVVAIEQGMSAFQDRSTYYDDNLGGSVTAKVYSRGNSGLNLSSGTPTPLKTFVDGVELLDGSYLGTLDPRSIDRIEIVTGPQAATIYGSGALGGVMQIFTKKGAVGHKSEYALNARYGMLESNLSNAKAPTHNYVLSVTGGDGPAFSYSANVSYDYSGQWQPNVFSRRLGASLGASYTRDRLTASGSVSTSATNSGMLGYSSGGVNLSPQGRDMIERGLWRQESVASAFSQRLSRTSNQTISFNIDYRLTPQWQHGMTVGRSGNLFSIVPESPGFYTTEDTLYRSSSANGQRTSWSYHTTYVTRGLGWLSSTLTMGVNGSSGLQTRSQGCIGTKTATSYVGCTAGAAPTVTQSISDNSWGGFGNLQLGLFEKAYLTLGLRGEKNPTYGAEHKIDWTPTNGIAYTNEVGDLTVKMLASYGSATRSPSADSKLGMYTVNPSYIPGSYISRFPNPELRPEYSKGPQGGLEIYYRNWGSITVNHYQQKVTDLINSLPVDSIELTSVRDGSVWKRAQTQSMNATSIRQYGWEATASLSVGALSVKGTYSWNESRILASDPRVAHYYPIGKSAAGVLTHTGNIILSYARGNTSVTTSTSIIGKSLTEGLDGFSDAFDYYDRRLTREIMYTRRMLGQGCNCPVSKDGYSKTDLAVSHRLTSWASAILNVVNVGSDYSSDVWGSRGWPSLGRQTSIGLSLRSR